MASYLPNITDYIPHLQPFKPDLNFYQKALETKEAQYKSGYDKISNLYGTLLNSEMLREPDIQKRDKFFRQIENDVQKLSTVDLSLQENIDSAYKVFQPLIDDKNLTKDMAWTKMYRREKQRGETFRNCIDEKECGGKWWEGGDRALDYMAGDFSKSDDSTALSFETPKYTPYTNTIEKAMKMAKDMGIEVQTVSHSKSGYIVTTTNGQQITGPLRNYFISAMAADPKALDMYKTQAYLNRKDWIEANKEKFGNDEDAAENVYLQEKIALINKSSEHPKKETDNTINFLTAQKQALLGKMNKEGIAKGDSKSIGSAWDVLVQQLEANHTAKAHYDKTTDQIKPDEIAGLDKRSLRYRVDGAMANSLLTFDMASAAQDYADLHRKVSETANPFALIDYKQKYERENRASSFEEKAALMTLQAKLKEGSSSPSIKWQPDEAGAGATAKGVNTLLEAQGDVNKSGKTAQDMSIGYTKKLYDYYYSKVRFGDAGEQTMAKAVLQSVFGGKTPAEGYINADFSLRYDDFARNKNIHNTGSYDSWDKVYKRALQSVKSQDSLKLIDPQTVSEFNEQEHGIQYKQDVSLAIANTYSKDRKLVYDYIKINGATTFSKDADLMGNSSSKEEFAQKFIARHQNEYEYRVGGHNITEDALDAHDEIEKQFPDIYNSNLVPGMSHTRPSATMGGGGLGSGARSTMVDGSNAGEEGYVTMGSIKKDAEDLATVVKFGPNLAVSPGGVSPLATESDPAAKGAVDFFINEYMKGGWKMSNEKRPIAKVTYSPVAASNKDTQAITFTFDETWAQKHKGTSKNPGATSTLFDGDEFKPTVTMYVPTATAKNIMNTRSQYSDDDILLQNNGKIVLNQFQDAGGSIEIERGEGGLKASGKVAYVDENGDFKYTTFPSTYSATTNVTEFRQRLTEILRLANQENLKQRLEILASQDKYFSVEQLQQALGNAR